MCAIPSTPQRTQVHTNTLYRTLVVEHTDKGDNQHSPTCNVLAVRVSEVNRRQTKIFVNNNPHHRRHHPASAPRALRVVVVAVVAVVVVALGDACDKCWCIRKCTQRNGLKRCIQFTHVAADGQMLCGRIPKCNMISVCCARL